MYSALLANIIDDCEFRTSLEPLTDNLAPPNTPQYLKNSLRLIAVSDSSMAFCWRSNQFW